MTTFLDTTGRPTYGVGLCARCARKFPLGELSEDPNFPALMVCRDDIDQYDPYRLAPRPEDQITLSFTRPDTPIATAPSGVIDESNAAFIVTEDNGHYLYIGSSSYVDRLRADFFLITPGTTDGLKVNGAGDLLLVKT